MSREVVRASELGLYVYCARAWRLRADGYESQNVAEMVAGSESHRAHGAQVVVSQRARRWSMLLFGAALLLLILSILAR